MKTKLVLTGCTAAILSASTLAADDKSFFPKGLDLTVPRLAAVSLLGLDPSKAGAPTSFNSFVTDYVRGRDLNDILEEGIAFGWSFDKLGFGKTIKSTDIDAIIGTDALLAAAASRRVSAARLQNTPMFSLAALKGDPGYTRTAVSVSFALIDKADWRYDVAGHADLFRGFKTLANEGATNQPAVAVFIPADSDDFIRSAMKEVQRKPYMEAGLSKQIDDVLAANPIDRTALNHVVEAVQAASIAKQVKEAEQLVDKQTKEANDNNTNNERLVVAFAGSGLQRDGDSGMKFDGSYAWLSYEKPMLGGGLTIFTKGFEHDTRYDSTSKAFVTGHGFDVGLRLRSGKKATSAFFAEGLYSEMRPRDSIVSRTIQVGYESKVGDQWLQLGFGPSFTEGKTVTVFGLSLKWNFDTKPALVKSGA